MSWERRHVSWHEEHVRRENGEGREVRYYLTRRERGGEERDLAVVGRERGVRHMVYQFTGKGKEVISSSGAVVKLRSRREVVDWLNSVVSGSLNQSSQASPLLKDACSLDTETLKDNKSIKHSHNKAESVWVGTPWTCRKKRKHYPAFLRSGVKISVNDFVFVLVEENKRLVAFLDDLYEDSRANKMVVVRWFHKIDEVGIILPHDYNDREIFFSLCLQDLSIECIDGLATVLSAEHFEKCLSHAQLSRLELFVCRSLFDNDEVTPYDITQIKGYWKQAILKQCTINCSASLKVHVNSIPLDGVVTRPRKRLRRSVEADQHMNTNLVASKVDMDVSKNNMDTCVSIKPDKVQKATQYLTLGSQIEVLSQDSGLRGCWFRAVVIKKHKDKVKVQYKDIKDAEDEAKNLQEWLPASKVAVRDPLGLRLAGRTTIRPSPSTEKEKVSLFLRPGTVTDVWLHDGWWEAMVLEKENDDKIHVYFPGEKQYSTFPYKSMRLSKEWTGNKWVNVKERPDLVTSIFSKINEKKLTAVVDANKVVREQPRKEDIVIKGDDVGAMNNKVKEMCFGRDLSKDDFFDQLKWKSSKRRTPNIVNKRRIIPRKMGSRVFADFFVSDSLKVDRDNCKYIGDCQFSSTVPSLASLVMSR